MKVQLTLHASSLPNVAGLFKGTSDPFAVVTLVATNQSSEPKVLGRTEVIKNNLNPRWAKAFIFDYDLGKATHIAVSLFDEVPNGKNIAMGSAMFEIGACLGKKGNTQAKKMKGGGTLFAHIEKSEGSGTLKLQLRGIKLTNVEFGIGFAKSDPFFEILRKTTGAKGPSWETIYRSKPVMNNLSPTWGEAVLNLSTLCSGDLNRPIKISVYDHERSGQHVFMGSFETNVNGLLASKSLGGDINNDDVQSAFQLLKKNRNTGQIVVLRADIQGLEDGPSKKTAATTVSGKRELHDTAPALIHAPSAPPAAFAPSARFIPPTASAPPTAFALSQSQPTFVDYISGGCELNLCVAIDFTGSNGDPRKPNTLHHINRDGSLNDYEKAITAIGEILAKYDSDQKFPVWGFGAKYGGVVRHCFQCGPTREVDGVDGILQAYRSVFRSGLIMSGPTVFTEVITLAATYAQKAQAEASANGQQAYTILLILTDGSVSNVNATASALLRAADAPLSVVIVGIGSADFSAMRFLDDFDTKGKRDIADFVEFNAHRHSKESLTASTLEEVPDHLVGYFLERGIMPLPPLQRGDDEIVIEPYNPEEEIDLSLDFGGDDDIVVEGGGTFIPASAY